MTVLARLFFWVSLLLAAELIVGGGWLIYLKGSPYYLGVGLLYALGSILILRTQAWGVWLYALALVLTVPWALWEAGWNYWALFPRLLAPLALTALAFGLAPTLLTQPPKATVYIIASLTGLGFALLFALAFVSHGTIKPSPAISYQSAQGDNTPHNWSSYGRTPEGLRYASFNQINRTNVNQLQIAWTYRTGDLGAGVDQNTPLQIDDLVYTCTPNDHVAALDVDTGQVRWQFDPKAHSPIWQRCRGLGYYATKNNPALPDNMAPALCQQRILQTTIDARLLALDAKTGALCPDFGNHGTVALSQHMGEIKPGYYFQTSAPLVARDYVIIGGWVLDNQSRQEPSGVVRAFDARNGALVWAWDLGNPTIHKEPPAGETYTRGTPNMWTMPAYDDTLGLVYLPLGNATPDYFGMNRPPHADDYNSSLVALDILTGRERWKFQTVHHDIWDYDLPSQPALIDLTDEQGHTLPAILQTTKRGQIFLLNRSTGKPIAAVEEKVVPQQGAAPEERLSPTQPYSVGLPTIGVERLTERNLWGATMYDQLLCRIAFRQLRYDGDFTPIGLTPALQFPGNAGGFNWGSVSVDSENQRVFMNDMRIASRYWLVKREDYAASARHKPPVPDGHGPSPMADTPYGEVTEFWLSPLSIPCNQPPYGTITALDLKTRQIAWQVPAGTTERLGPWGIPSHLPMPVGVPTYAGTSTTAGGLVFFAGSQDYYLRAYDAETGQELWKYPLPVGSSATPMTYISPNTNRQYIVISVGGAAHSKQRGDYVIAFALPALDANTN